jgi:hypothetical protein
MAFNLDIRVRTTPKAGNTESQNEDAAALGPKLRRVAIADGASEGWQSGPWARVVAAAFVRTPPTPESFDDWVGSVREKAPKSETTSWYAEEKAALGSFATMLGLAFEDAKDGGIRWRAVAVGDSCLFQVRGEKLLAKFPVESVADFSNRPKLVGSAPGAEVAEPDWFAGRGELHDVFYLLTDALAEWFLRLRNANARPENELDRVTEPSRPPAAFADWIKSLRDAKAIRNDDCTAVRVELLPLQESP